MGKSPFTMPGSGFYGKGNQSVTPGKYSTPAKHGAKLGVDSDSQEVIDAHTKWHKDNPNAGKLHDTGGKRAEFDKEGNYIPPGEKDNAAPKYKSPAKHEEGPHGPHPAHDKKKGVNPPRRKGYGGNIDHSKFNK